MATAWEPNSPPDSHDDQISQIENRILELRKVRRAFESQLEAATAFQMDEAGFASEVEEQIDRLKSIRSLPKNPKTKKWQWPFAQENLAMGGPIAEALLKELTSLDEEMKTVTGSKPALESFMADLRGSIESTQKELRSLELQLAAAISSNEAVEQLKSQQTAAARTLGRISYFLQNIPEANEADALDSADARLGRYIKEIEDHLESTASDEKVNSALNVISYSLSKFVTTLGVEFREFPFRFDLRNLTVVVDRPERPVPMNRTGGAENHLAHHISALLSIHSFAFKNNCPIPNFLVIDQPSQVYFPDEKKYKAADGSTKKTEEDADVAAVRRFFKFLLSFTQKVVPGFQIIVTEHANLKDAWFQNCLVEPPWKKPPALIPEDWPQSPN